MDLLPEEADILDFGCGSGRDTKYFLEHGYHVEAIDGSINYVDWHQHIQELRQDICCFKNCLKERYDGIWACASILHLNKAELSDVLKRCHKL